MTYEKILESFSVIVNMFPLFLSFVDYLIIYLLAYLQGLMDQSNQVSLAYKFPNPYFQSEYIHNNLRLKSRSCITKQAYTSGIKYSKT